MSAVTLVSLVPKELKADMPHMYPSNYVIAPAMPDDISILVIRDGIDNVYVLDGKTVPRTVPAEDIAANFISMCFGGMLGVGEDARPGLFYITGELSKNAVAVAHKDKIKEERKIQMAWFANLLAQADDVWQKYHNHGMISELHKEAATALGQSREWLVNFTNVSLCPACGVRLMNPNVLRCPTCTTIIKPEEFNKRFGKAS